MTTDNKPPAKTSRNGAVALLPRLSSTARIESLGACPESAR